jgi:hypothetical protein
MNVTGQFVAAIIWGLGFFAKDKDMEYYIIYSTIINLQNDIAEQRFNFFAISQKQFSARLNQIFLLREVYHVNQSRPN